MNGTAGLVTVTFSTIASIVIASIFLSNSFQASMDLLRADITEDMQILRADITEDMNVLRADMNIMQADIKALQDKTARMDAKLELLLDTWAIARPPFPEAAGN